MGRFSTPPLKFRPPPPTPPGSRGVFSRASAGHKRKSLVKIGEVTRAQRCWLYVPTGNLFDDRRSHPAEKTPDTWALGTRGADPSAKRWPRARNSLSM